MGFIRNNVIGILFVLGIGIINYGFFLIGYKVGIFAVGVSILLISLILAKERG